MSKACTLFPITRRRYNDIKADYETPVTRRNGRNKTAEPRVQRGLRGSRAPTVAGSSPGKGKSPFRVGSTSLTRGRGAGLRSLRRGLGLRLHLLRRGRRRETRYGRTRVRLDPRRPRRAGHLDYLSGRAFEGKKYWHVGAIFRSQVQIVASVVCKSGIRIAYYGAGSR